MCHQSLGPVFHIPTTQGQSLVPHPGMTQPAGLALPSGKLRLCYQKWPIYSGFTHQKWWSAIVFCMFARGQPDYGVCPPPDRRSQTNVWGSASHRNPQRFYLSHGSAMMPNRVMGNLGIHGITELRDHSWYPCANKKTARHSTLHLLFGSTFAWRFKMDQNGKYLKEKWT